MRTVKDISQDEFEKIKNFYDFYTPTLVKKYSELLANYEKNNINTETYRAYLNIVNRTASLIKNLAQTTNPFVACAIFQYLLWYGYLSKDHQLIYSISNRVNNLSMTGADIMLGKSVCLNNADMQTSVLRALGNNAYLMGCIIDPRKEANFEYRPNIHREIDSKEKLMDRLKSKLIGLTPLKNIGNHAVSIFNYNTAYFVSDPTSLAFGEFYDFLKIRYIGSSLSVEAKASLSLILRTINPKEFTDIINTIYLMSDRRYINVNFVKNIYEEVINLCRHNEPVLDDFHNQNKQDIDILCHKLKLKP